MSLSIEKGRRVRDPMAAILLVVALLVVFAVDLNRKRELDMVFMFDKRDGKPETLEAVTATWSSISQSITNQGFDCRFAVIAEDQPHASRQNTFCSLPDLEKAIQEVKANTTLQPISKTYLQSSLDQVLKLPFREQAKVVLFVVSNSGLDASSTTVREIRSRQITVIVQADEAKQDSFRPLYSHDGGKFFTFDGLDKTEADDANTSQSELNVGGLISPVNSGRSGAIFTLAGVKVRGRLALVCDTSGSMADDFPPLIEELRQKFPADTPLLLVNGCSFLVPNGDNPKPQKLLASGDTKIVCGVDFSNDQHVYFCENTTDAVITAVTEFHCDTVMFNNDLQDGGSNQAIEAFEELRSKTPFTLSGRSLNCDAPEVLKDFIQKSGGDFKVEAINRAASQAVDWGN